MKNEFSIIKKIITNSEKNTINHPSVIIPPGDDASLLTALKRPVISTDTQRENVHFKLNWSNPEEIGFKAVVVTLSDLAASYAKPVALFINLGIPTYISEDFIESLYIGINNALKTYNCALGGGNISSSKELSIDLFAIGNGDSKIFPARSNAKEGHGLYVTGQIGLARAGLDSLLQNRNELLSIRQFFKNPKARFDASKILKSHNVSCVMDVSDGVAGDAEHIAVASDLSIEFILKSKDLSNKLINYCQNYNLSDVEMALAGGEDYELLFTCPHEVFEKIEVALPEAFKIGVCLPFTGVHILNRPEKHSSFRHLTDKTDRQTL